RDLQLLLDDELNRLPEKYRTPFVLCCLDGKSKREVAQELGWKEGTVSTRIGWARERLQQRLIRRGVALSAVLCATAISQNLCSAVIPPPLANATVEAAVLFAAGKTGKAMSAQAARLASGLLRTAWLNSLKHAAAMALIFAAITVGAVAHHASRAKQTEA